MLEIPFLIPNNWKCFGPNNFILLVSFLIFNSNRCASCSKLKLWLAPESTMVPFAGVELMIASTNISPFSRASFWWETFFWIANKNFNAPIQGISPSSSLSTSTFASLEYFTKACSVVNEPWCGTQPLDGGPYIRSKKRACLIRAWLICSLGSTSAWGLRFFAIPKVTWGIGFGGPVL